MLKVNIADTIAAVSTAQGSGGIGIVRMSGDDAIAIADKVFRSQGGVRLADKKSHTVTYGHIYNGDVIEDEVLVSIFRAPKSYTVEDVVEIGCHGGIRAVNAVLQLLIKNGARQAQPGEFTQRAFLNGRIDMTQAEAVIDVINAKTQAGKNAAMQRLEGRLSRKIKALREKILLMIAHIETSIDYPEHDDETMTYNTIENGVVEVEKEIENLISTAESGKIFREGIKTVILGRPNVGKSSLLNTLLEEDRAIVTDIPGTTRDVLEEMINVKGIPLNLVDTAGIRETEDTIEKIGVEKSLKLADNADLVLLMLNGSQELNAEDRELIERTKDKNVIVIINKSDLGLKVDASDFKNSVVMSVKNEDGIDSLYEQISDMFMSGKINSDNEVLISNERNKSSLIKAQNYLENVLSTVRNRLPEDFISMDLTEAYAALGEVTGESLEEDIIDKIFSEFCLGK
jgi:tRNA modification GTPase